MSAESAIPKVAILTPVYNGAKFIADNLQSVQVQTYPNIVHMVQDNACTDGTDEILARLGNERTFVERNPTLVPITQNFNKVFARRPADAKYAMILCADDILMPDAVEAMVALAETDDEIVAVTGKAICMGRVHDHQWPKGVAIDGKEAVRQALAARATVTGLFVLFRTSAMEDPFFQTEFISNDADAAFRVMRTGKFGYVDTVVADMRLHDASQANAHMTNRYLHLRDFLNLIDLHGPHVFDAQGFKDVRRAYMRFYARRMAAWGLQYGKWDVVKQHLNGAAERGAPISAFDFVDAFWDRALSAVGLRTQWKDNEARRQMLFEIIPPPDYLARKAAGRGRGVGQAKPA